ncbi:MAG TPA: hypothetical protein VH912_12135 [Streptosporangiaceae bacterium]
MNDPRATAAAVKWQIVRLGGGFMISREAKAYSEWTGLQGWGPYMRGRCGVLGDVDADVVTAAVGFFPPAEVRAAWDSGRGTPAAETMQAYTRVCQEYGRRKLAGFADADRLAELMEPVARSADVAGAPLFAGWRALPLPPDGPARVLQLAHVLRELRGGRHLAAVLATGLTPLEAVLSGGSQLVADGADNARYFRWPEPYAEVTDEMRARRTRAEELTDDLVAPAFAALTDAEADELVALLDKACAVAFP